MLRIRSFIYILGLAVSTAYAGRFDTWGFVAELAFNGYKHPDTLTNFPVLVILSTNGINGFRYDQCKSTNGWDLRFSDSSGEQELNYDIERWNTNGESFVWVEVPALSSNTHIRIHWDNGRMLTPAPYSTNGATWTNGFVGVWHLGESAPPNRDSTSNRFHGTKMGTPTYGSAGQIGRAVDIGGPNNGIKITDQSPLDMGASNFTVSVWVRKQATSSGWSNIGMFSKWITGASPGNNEWSLDTSVSGADNRPVFTIEIGTAKYSCPDDANLTLNTWYQIAGKREGTTLHLFVNGVLQNSTTGVVGSVNNVGRDLYLGYFLGGPALSLNGRVDEARISNLARSSNWLHACWLNQASNSLFITYGAARKTGGTVIFVK